MSLAIGHSDEAAWRAAIDLGRVLVNGRRAAPEQPLAAGDELEFHRPPWREPDAPESFTVAFEDEHVLVVVKPANLQVLPAGPFSARTLLELVRASDASRARGRAGASARPRHVGSHRVRQDGARPLVAEPPAARAHARQDVSRVGRRRALAELVRGAAADRACPARPADDPCRGGARPGVVDARARAAPRGARTLVAAQPITGRPDQIRIHLAAAGAPIVGDPLFGPGGVPKSDAPPGAGGYLAAFGGAKIRSSAERRAREASLAARLVGDEREVDSS